MPQIVGSFAGLDSNEQAWAVSSLREDWLTFHAAVAISVAIYWLLMVMLGRGRLLRFRSSNVTLAVFVAAVMALVLYASIGPWGEGLKGVCPLIGISDADAPPFGFDTPSSCEAFIYGAHQVIGLGLLGLPILLLTISLIARIVSSRSARPADG